MIKTLNYNRRAFLYSFIVSLGLVFLMTLEVNRPSLYVVSAVILYLVILFEMFYIWFVSKEKLKQLDLPLLTTFTKFKEFVNHLFLPSFLYLSLVGFIYFNNGSNVRIPLIVISFIAFSALFINLKAFYLDKFSLEKNTYFVYDLIELTIYFNTTNLILHLGEFFSVSIAIQVLFVTGLTFVILFLNLYQFDEIRLLPLILTVLFSSFSGIHLFIIMEIFGFGIIASTTIQFLVYYLVFGVLRHKIEGTLSYKVILEYLSVFFLSLAVLIGIS